MYARTVVELIAQQYQTDRYTEAARSRRGRGFMRRTPVEG